jgi:DNA-binding MarR family transcriptional regulator
VDTNNLEKVYKAIQKFKKISSFSEVFSDMSHSEFIMMKLIQDKTEEEKGVKISTLSSFLMISNPAVSQMINTLETKGYVERITTKNDRRVVYVTLTKLGEANLEKACQSFVRVASDILGKMGQEDTETLLRLLDKLYRIADEYKSNDL